MVPPDQYQFLVPNQQHISTYVRAYDLAVDWQPWSTSPRTLNSRALRGLVPTPAHLSFQAMLTLALTLMVPLVAWRRGHPPARVYLLWLLWMTTVYVTVVSNAVELAENNRFRMELGPLPIVATAFVLVAVTRAHSRRSARQSRTPG